MALLIAPAIWRRAVFLTRKRIESSVPLTVNELQAGKDRMRAEHAVSLRKMEIRRDELLEKLAAQQPEITKLEQKIRSLNSDIDDRKQELADAEARVQERDAELAERESEIRSFQLHIDTMEADLAARTGELDSFKRMRSESEKRLATMMERFEETNADLSALQIDMDALRDNFKQSQAELRDSRAMAKETSQALEDEQQTVARLEKQLEKAKATRVKLEDKLESRDLEIARSRETMSIEAKTLSDYERQAEDSEAERAALERELTELTLAYNALEKRLEDKPVVAVSDEKSSKKDESNTTAALEIKLGQALAQLKSVTAERDEAVASIAKSASQGGNQAGDDELREQINQLAAEMVHLTEKLEGEGTPIGALLAQPGANDSNVVSLADRINALRSGANKAAE